MEYSNVICQKNRTKRPAQKVSYDFYFILLFNQKFGLSREAKKKRPIDLISFVTGVKLGQYSTAKRMRKINLTLFCWKIKRFRRDLN